MCMRRQNSGIRKYQLNCKTFSSLISPFLLTARHFQRPDGKKDNILQHTIKIIMLHDLQTSGILVTFNVQETGALYADNLHYFQMRLRHVLKFYKSMKLTHAVMLLVLGDMNVQVSDLGRDNVYSY